MGPGQGRGASRDRLDQVLYSLAEGLRVLDPAAPRLHARDRRPAARRARRGRPGAGAPSAPAAGGQRVERAAAAVPEDRGWRPLAAHPLAGDRSAPRLRARGRHPRPPRHLRARRRRARRAARAGPGVRRILTVGLDEESNREAIAAAEAHAEVFACVGRHPNSAAGFDERPRPRISRRWPPTSASWRSARPGSTSSATAPTRAISGAAFEAQIEIARRTGLPLVIHLRDRRGLRRRPRRGVRDAGRGGRGRDGGPPLLLGAARPGRRGHRARLVLLVRRQRHLSEAGRAARGGAAGPRGAAPGRDRLAVPGAAAGSRQAEPARATWSRWPSGWPRSAASAYAELERGWRPTPPASSDGDG